MSAQIGIESKDRQAVAKILHRILADEYVLKIAWMLRSYLEK